MRHPPAVPDHMPRNMHIATEDIIFASTCAMYMCLVIGSLVIDATCRELTYQHESHTLKLGLSTSTSTEHVL
jgi:hypothetical protein